MSRTLLKCVWFSIIVISSVKCLPLEKDKEIYRRSIESEEGSSDKSSDYITSERIVNDPKENSGEKDGITQIIDTHDDGLEPDELDDNPGQDVLSRSGDIFGRFFGH